MNETTQTPVTSLASLIAANLIPVFGVLVLDWDATAILSLYWLETAVIGVFTLLRLASSSHPQARGAARFVMMPFFAVHFGIFMFVHGIFVAVTTGLASPTSTASPLGLIQKIFANATGTGFLVAIGGLFTSHGISFALNFIGQGERNRVPLPRIMMAPYPRVIVMHFTILFGGALTIYLGQPMVIVLLLVAIKTVIDAMAHIREHRNFMDEVPPTAAGAHPPH